MQEPGLVLTSPCKNPLSKLPQEEKQNREPLMSSPRMDLLWSEQVPPNNYMHRHGIMTSAQMDDNSWHHNGPSIRHVYFTYKLLSIPSVKRDTSATIYYVTTSDMDSFCWIIFKSKATTDLSSLLTIKSDMNGLVAILYCSQLDFSKSHIFKPRKCTNVISVVKRVAK